MHQTGAVKVVVISGPIASGKSTVGRAVAVELSGLGFDAAIVDLDLVYEILDPPLEPKTDASKWSEARRLAAQITSDLVGSRSAVVIEGEFATESQRAEFEDALPNDLDARFVTLALDVDEAWRRASTDFTRGISRDRDFLVAHYEAWNEMPPIASDFTVANGEISAAVAARLVANWLLDGSDGYWPRQ